VRQGVTSTAVSAQHNTNHYGRFGHDNFPQSKVDALLFHRVRERLLFYVEGKHSASQSLYNKVQISTKPTNSSKLFWEELFVPMQATVVPSTQSCGRHLALECRRLHGNILQRRCIPLADLPPVVGQVGPASSGNCMSKFKESSRMPSAFHNHSRFLLGISSRPFYKFVLHFGVECLKTACKKALTLSPINQLVY
jgi:hypothetical protein